MRKDVKLGFAIGGVLLAVLIVYVLVISGSDTTNQNEQVTLATGDSSAAADSARPVAPPAEAKPSRPSASATVAGGGTAPATPANNTDPFQSSLPAAAVSHDGAATPATRPSEDRWAASLHNGLPAMMTITPDPRPSAPPAVIPAEANRPTPGNSTTGSGVTDLPIAASNRPAGAPITGATMSPSTRPVESSLAPGNRSHVVAQGETFASIAAAVYGSSAYYPHLIRANPNIDPRRLKPGMTITVPAVSDVRADSSTASAAGSTSAAPKTSASPASQTLDEKSEYRVQAGDNLNKISSKLYGRTDRISKIYELNKTLIGDDPAKLKVGTVLKLPEPPTVK